jgi:hypothetical protein
MTSVVTNTEKELEAYLTNSHVLTVIEWLTNRAAFRDAKFRIDLKSGEDAEALIVSFLQRRGLSDPASDKLAQALVRILRELDPVVSPTDVEALALRICQQVYVPRTTSWFVKQLKRIVGNIHQTLDPMDDAVARAAVVQAHVTHGGELRPVWAKLLESPRYATIALHGLTRTWAQQTALLDVWWSNASARVRERELRYMLKSALREHGATEVVSVCRGHVTRWSPVLREAVDRIIESEGYMRPFRVSQQSALKNALDGAARRPELVLEDTA